MLLAVTCMLLGKASMLAKAGCHLFQAWDCLVGAILQEAICARFRATCLELCHKLRLIVTFIRLRAA